MSSFDGICRMIEAGLGVGVLPDGALRPENTGLHAIRLTDPWARRSLWLGVCARASLAPEARKLPDHLRHGE